jgi:hypothetical protein
MVWIDNISRLQYYNQPKDVPCYCETLMLPQDMMLQGVVPQVPGNSYTMQIKVLSADGLTVYEDATSYFTYYFAKMPDGRWFFNARLNSYSPAMCAHECFVLYVLVTHSGSKIAFDKWTERYCITDCCSIVTGVDLEQTAFFKVIAPGSGDEYGPSTDPVSPTGVSNPTSPCGDPYITITSGFDCYDKFTGEYYGNPSTKYSTSGPSGNFAYQKKSHIRGSIRKLPREIKREYSLNCRLQQVQSMKQYDLEGYEYFPAWKMEEIEAQLHGSYIHINNYVDIDEQVEYLGGKPFESIRLTSTCKSLYKLNAVLNECEVTQIFGCGDKCSTEGSKAIGFVIAPSMQAQAYYSENRTLIGNDCETLMQYYLGQPGVTAVEPLDAEDYDCDFSCGFIVYSEGYVPTSFYVNTATPGNRIFGQSIESLASLCQQITPACIPASIGELQMEDSSCAAIMLDDLGNEDMPAEELYITGHGDWVPVDAFTYATRSQATVVVNIEVENENYTYDSGDPEAELPVINGEQIGYISQGVWPATNIIFNNSNNNSLPDGAVLVIATNGKIYYNGTVTIADLAGATITLTNLTYTL